MESCIFCEISKGNIKTPGIFWEDDDYMAFLSTFPNMKGVTVVVPKEHYSSDVLGMDDENLCNFTLTAKKVSNILVKYYEDVGRVGLVMEGTGIDHAHIKLYPMHGTEHLIDGEWKQHASKIDTVFDTYPGYISSNDGPEADKEEISQLASKLKEIQ